MRRLVVGTASGACLVLALARCGLDDSGDLDSTGGQSSSGSGGKTLPDSGNLPTGGAGGSVATGGSTGSEDCLNDKDDDNDGLIDCADDDCGTYRCVPPVPSGWIGPVAFFLGAGPAPECATTGYATEKNSGGTVTAQPATCPVCSCGLGNLGCHANVKTYPQKGCAGAPLVSLDYAASGCQEFSSPGPGQNSFLLSAAPPSGNCASSSTGQKTVQPPTYDPVGRLCGADQTGAGCSGKQLCVPELPSGFGELCVYRDGDTTCPPIYPTKKSMAVGFDDKRDCTACTCKPACAITADGHSDSDCGDGVLSTVGNGGCGDIDDQGLCGVAVKMTAGCSPAGGVPSGSVEPKLVTLCCL